MIDETFLNKPRTTSHKSFAEFINCSIELVNSTLEKHSKDRSLLSLIEKEKFSLYILGQEYVEGFIDIINNRVKQAKEGDLLFNKLTAYIDGATDFYYNACAMLT